MSNINHNNSGAQHGLSSSNELFNVPNNDWLRSLNELDIFGANITAASVDNVAGYNAQGRHHGIFNFHSDSAQLHGNNSLPTNDAQLDGQHGIGNNTNDDIRDHSVVVCPFNDYRYTADPVLSTTEGVNYGREENREEQRKFLPRTEQNTMTPDTQAEMQYVVHFPSYITYPADVLMITQKRDRHSPYADYTSRYTSTSMARRCREKTRMYPRFTCKYNQDPTDEYDDTADDVVNNWLSWKERVFNSLTNLQDVEDKKSSSGYKHFAEKFYATKMIEARCSEVVELCVDLHVNGTKVDDWHNLALQTPSDLDLKCRERMERICEFLEREKMACENVMAGTDAIRRLVLAPIAAWKRKMQNRRGNTHKSQELQFAKTLRTSREQDVGDDSDCASTFQGRKRTYSRTAAEQTNASRASISTPATDITGSSRNTRDLQREDQPVTKKRRILPTRECIFTRGESSSSAARRGTGITSVTEPPPADLTAAEIFASGPFATGSYLAGSSSSPSSAVRLHAPHSSPPGPPAAGPSGEGLL